MKQILWIVLLFLYPFMACTQIDKKNFLFEAELTVAYTIPIHEMFPPLDLHIHNDFLILSNVGNPGYSLDYFFQAYRLSDLTYTGSFGRRGRGPNEWVNPDVVRSSVNCPYFYFWDVSSRQSTAVIHKMVLDSMALMTEKDPFLVEKGYSFMNRPVIRNDSLLVFDEFMPDQRAVRVHHLHGERPVTTWYYGLSSSNSHPFFDENMGTLLANDSCIIFIYRFKDRIDIMDWDLKLKKRMNYQRGKLAVHEDRSEMITYYSPSYLGDHFLYTFYMGMSIKERQNRNVQSLDLEVSDLNGTSICHYTFSTPTPSIFAVDERTFTLYGYRGDNGMEDCIYVYQLSGLKEYLQNR